MRKVPYSNPLIAKEGWPFIGLCFIFLVFSMLLHFYLFFILFLVVIIFVTQFFRDPKRSTAATENDLVSPADGRVVAIEECNDPYRNQPAKKISIFMNVFNVHSQRIPADGEVVSITYNPGKFLNASLDKSSVENERNAVVLKLSTGHEITVVQVAGLIARRILCYISLKQKVKLGQRYGFIRFGSRVDLYIPLNSIVKVGLGETVSATTTILANICGVKNN
jgi:phosphatidylserine decarboxylase